MTPPAIENSTKEERQAYVLEAWKCLHDCYECGKCRILKGWDAETLYADYINGTRSYMEVTFEIRDNSRNNLNLWKLKKPYSTASQEGRRSQPTNEREHNQACLYFAKREGGRWSQMFVKACANEWNAKLALAFCNECSQASPKASGRRTDYVDDIKGNYVSI